MALDAFAVDSGSWQVSSGKLQVAADSLGLDAVSVFHVDQMLPYYYEILASISTDKPIQGWKSNAYVIFDYYSPTDFKFAGIDISTNKLQMGHRDATGWVVDVQSPARLKPNQAYNVLVAVNGTAVTMIVNGDEVFSFAYEARVVDGYSHALNTGMIGMGSNNSRGSFDNIKVQVIAPELTFADTEDFSDGQADLFAGAMLGQWQIEAGRYNASLGSSSDIAVNLIDLGLDNGLQLDSVLQLSATVNTQSIAGIVFDYYSRTNFKFAAISAQTGQVIIGHADKKGGLQFDVIAERSIRSGKDYTLFVSIKSSTVSITINGQTAASHVFNAVAVDADFGLFTDSESSFDNFVIKTNDPAFDGQNIAGVEYLMTASVVEKTGDISAEALTAAQLEPIIAEAIAQLAETYQLDDQAIALLNSVSFEIADLDGALLGQTTDALVLIDINAAGFGWFVDTTPSDNTEFTMQADGILLANSDEATGKIDLLTVVMHELSHVLGLGDIAEDINGNDLMSDTLNESVRIESADTQDASEITIATDTTEPILQEEPVLTIVPEPVETPIPVPEPVMVQPEDTQLPSPNKSGSTGQSAKGARSRSK